MSEESRGRHAAPDLTDRGARDARHRLSGDTPLTITADPVADTPPAPPAPARHRLHDVGGTTPLPDPPWPETTTATTVPADISFVEPPSTEPYPRRRPGENPARTSVPDSDRDGRRRTWDPLSDPLDPADLIPLDQPDISDAGILGPAGVRGADAGGADAGRVADGIGGTDGAHRARDTRIEDGVNGTPIGDAPTVPPPAPDAFWDITRPPMPTLAETSGDLTWDTSATTAFPDPEPGDRTPPGSAAPQWGQEQWGQAPSDRPQWDQSQPDRPPQEPAPVNRPLWDRTPAWAFQTPADTRYVAPANPAAHPVNGTGTASPDIETRPSPTGRPETRPGIRPAVPRSPGRHGAFTDTPATGTSAGADASRVAMPADGRRTAPDAAIEAVDLRKSFGDHVAVDGVTLRADRGSIFALLGPNGAGKTTTVNMLCTLLRPDSGHATVAGRDVVHDPSGVRRSIMLTGQFAALDESLTGRENLILFGRLLGLRKRAATNRADELLAAFGLTAAAERRVGQYSGGMRRRIDIACGLVTSPEVVFLDEPTTGLDPRSRQEVWRLVENLRDQGVTTLLTTQYLEEADALSDRIVVIDHGRVIAEGTSDDLKSRIGTSAYEVTPADPAQLGEVRSLLAHLLPSTDRHPAAPADGIDQVSLTVPAPDGADTLVEIVRLTSSAGLRLSDVSLRRPSLDEVFLTLTGPDAPRGPETPTGPGAPSREGAVR